MIYFSPTPVAQKQDLLKVLSERITGVDLKGACPAWALFARHLRHIICAARGTTQHLRVVRRGGVDRVACGAPRNLGFTKSSCTTCVRANNVQVTAK